MRQVDVHKKFRSLCFRLTDIQNSKDVSPQRSLTAKKTQTKKTSQQRSLTAKKSDSKEISQQIIPQQRKLMGSTAQNSSGVHWRRRRVRFNRVPEKVLEKVREGVPKKVLEKIPGGFGAEPGRVQQGSEEGSGEGLGGFGAEPGQAQQGFGESSGEDSGKLWCKAKSGSTGFRRRFRRRSGRLPEKVLEALVQSQVKLNRVLERLIRAPESGSLRAPWDHLEHQKSGSLRAPENHIFRVTLGDTGLGHGVRHSNLIIFIAVPQTRTALLFHDQLPVGWGGVKTFMFLCTHRQDVPATS